MCGLRNLDTRRPGHRTANKSGILLFSRMPREVFGVQFKKGCKLAAD